MVLVSKEHLFKPLYVLNFSYDNWISNSIKKITNNHWAHSGIILEVDKDNVTILESVHKTGPIVSKYSKEWLYNLYNKKQVEVINFGLYSRNQNKILEKYLNLNKRYGFESILAILLSKLGFKTNFNIIGSVICSELVSRLIYDFSNKQIRLGFKEDTEESEYKLPFYRIEPGHISLSKYGERVRCIE